jgi:hypothetical protein
MPKPCQTIKATYPAQVRADRLGEAPGAGVVGALVTQRAVLLPRAAGQECGMGLGDANAGLQLRPLLVGRARLCIRRARAESTVCV